MSDRTPLPELELAPVASRRPAHLAAACDRSAKYASTVPMLSEHYSSATAPKPSYTEFQPGKTAHGASNSPDAAEIDIRQLSVSARRALLHGPLVIILVNGYQISTIPLGLLSATSTRLPNLPYAGAINLPADTA
ncbi:hypothetical protein E8E12_008909 [Didymella heteroderae]|uniref:Uncharacterized protein n=1 Tax=Didymella heteroderae TaxID=1769908 RepID=A0A9P4WRR1_9PLEO|nr:hypothetical protein E8E12_008909 [Didymella heteroderae]